LTAVSVQGFDVDEQGEACVEGTYENTGRSIKRRWFVQQGRQDLETPKDNTLRVSERARVLVRACVIIEERRVSCAARFRTLWRREEKSLAAMVVMSINRLSICSLM
jgi:hypothetical protein